MKTNEKINATTAADWKEYHEENGDPAFCIACGGECTDHGFDLEAEHTPVGYAGCEQLCPKCFETFFTEIPKDVVLCLPLGSWECDNCHKIFTDNDSYAEADNSYYCETCACDLNIKLSARM